MYREVSKLAARQGVDARDFALLPFGGAGPMLGCLLARELGIRTVLIPPAPGVLSALGGLIADIRNDFIETAYRSLDVDSLPALLEGFARLAAAGTHWIREEQGFAGPVSLSPSADMRYAGQSFEIEVPLRQEWLDRADLGAIAAAFHAEHERVYGHADPAAPIQVISLRMVVAGAVPGPRFPEQPRLGGAPEALRTVEVFLDGAWRSAPLYRRADLRHGHRFAGPCVVLQEDTTTCVPEGFDGAVDSHGNLLLTWPGA
jgi:N-methylhydantoinase A